MEQDAFNELLIAAIKDPKVKKALDDLLEEEGPDWSRVDQIFRDMDDVFGKWNTRMTKTTKTTRRNTK